MILVAFLAVSIVASSPQAADVQENAGKQRQPANYQTATPSCTAVIAQTSSAERQDENQNPSYTKNRFLSWCERYQGFINLISTALVAVFTGILTWYTILLWKSGEKHSERELRAYVFPVDFKVRNFKTALSTLSPAQNIYAFVRIKNTGQTPAYKVTCQVKMTVGPFPQTDFTISEKEAEFAPTHIGPGVEISCSPVKDTLLPMQHAKGVIEGGWAIYVFGRIDYVDAFTHPRWTTFRTLARGDQGVMALAEGKDVLLLAADEEGNDAS